MTPLLHLPVPPWLACDDDGIGITLICHDATVVRVWVRTLPDNEEQLVEMAATGPHGNGNGDGAVRLWRARVPWDGGNTTTRYAFKAVTAQAQLWLAANGPWPHVPPDDVHFRVHPHERPPAWVREQVFYQVFPDRFARGREPADRRGELLCGSALRPVVQKAWDDPIDADNAANSFWGGDLPGLQAQLDHIQHAVGATALYLNPVFQAGSNHRYDTEDYLQVDPHLGGNDALAALCDAVHARGMRIVLDAVVNHTGTGHPWFNRWGRHAGLGAAQSPDSPWRAWYAFDAAGQPVGWKGHASLPVLDFGHPPVAEAMYAGPQAVLRHWLRPPWCIDGWRLDVVHMMGEGPGAANNAHHVRGIRRAMREENPDAYVLGEHFFEATRWLQGDQEDGAMNYHGFLRPLRAWLAGQDTAGAPALLPTADTVRWLMRALAGLPPHNQLAQLNLLDSHDTPRLLTLLGGDIARMTLAVTMLFAWAGVPCIYYGDEIGLQGGDDPDCRRPFPWDRSRWHAGLLAHYRALAGLRAQRPEWRHGAVMPLAQGEHWFAFARVGAAPDAADADAAAQAVPASVVIVNRGPAVRAALPLGRVPGAGRGPGRRTGWAAALGELAATPGHRWPPEGAELQLPAVSATVLLAEHTAAHAALQRPA